MGAGADVFVDAVERRDGRHGADGDSAELLVRLERDHHLVFDRTFLVPEGEAVSASFVDHGDGGGALRELHEVHGVDAEAGPASTSGRLKEVEHRRNVSGAVEACQDPELRVGSLPLNRPVLVR